MSTFDEFMKCIFEIIEAYLQDKKENKTISSINNPNNFGSNALVCNQGQDIEQVILNSILNPVHMKKTAKYLARRDGKVTPLMEVYDGSRINESGYIEEIHEEVYHTMDDGTSMSGYAECMNCGRIVSNSNIFRCKCGKTVCILCSVKSSHGNHYCSGWHKLLASE